MVLLAVGETQAPYQQRRLINPHLQRRFARVPWLKVSPITGRPRHSRSQAKRVLVAQRWKVVCRLARAPGKKWRPAAAIQEYLRRDGEALVQMRLRDAAAVKLAGTGHGHQRVAAAVEGGGNRQLIAAKRCRPADAINRGGRFLLRDKKGAGRLTGQRDWKRSDRFIADRLKAEIQRSLPAFFCLW